MSSLCKKSFRAAFKNAFDPTAYHNGPQPTTYQAFHRYRSTKTVIPRYCVGICHPPRKKAFIHVTHKSIYDLQLQRIQPTPGPANGTYSRRDCPEYRKNTETVLGAALTEEIFVINFLIFLIFLIFFRVIFFFSFRLLLIFALRPTIVGKIIRAKRVSN